VAKAAAAAAAAHPTIAQKRIAGPVGTGEILQKGAAPNDKGIAAVIRQSKGGRVARIVVVVGTIVGVVVVGGLQIGIWSVGIVCVFGWLIPWGQPSGEGRPIVGFGQVIVRRFGRILRMRPISSSMAVEVGILIGMTIQTSFLLGWVNHGHGFQQMVARRGRGGQTTGARHYGRIDFAFGFFFVFRLRMILVVFIFFVFLRRRKEAVQAGLQLSETRLTKLLLLRMSKVLMMLMFIGIRRVFLRCRRQVGKYRIIVIIVVVVVQIIVIEIVTMLVMVGGGQQQPVALFRWGLFGDGHDIELLLDIVADKTAHGTGGGHGVVVVVASFAFGRRQGIGKGANAANPMMGGK